MTSLLLHQLKTDFRSQRTFMIFWLGVLSLRLGMLLGWVGAPPSTWPFEDGWLMQLLPTMLGSMMIFLPLVIALATMQQDSPARPTGFLRTRPIPIQTLFLSKYLFLLLGMALPMVLFEGLHLFLGQMPLDVVARGMMEHAAWVIPALVLVSVPSVTFRNPRSMALFLPWTYLCCLLGLGVLFLLSRLPGGELWFPQSNSWDGFGMACRIALLLLSMLSVVWLLWARRQRRASWKVLASWFLVVLLAEWGGWAGRTVFSPSGVQPDEVAGWAESEAIQIHPEDLSAFFERRSDDQISIGWKAQADLSNLPENWFVLWADREARLSLPNQREKTQKQSFSLGRMFESLPQFTRKELKSMSGLAPEGALMEVMQHGLTDQQIYVRPFEIPDPATLSAPARLKLSVEGHVCRWIEAAVMDLRPGSSTRHSQTRWKIHGVKFPENRQSVELLLEEKDPRLHFAGSASENEVGFHFENRFRYVLYDPIHKTGQLLTDRPRVVRSLGDRLTALGHRWLKLQFQERHLEQAGWNSTNPSLELRIYEREYLGPFHKSFEVHLPAQTLQPGSQLGHNLQVERIPREDYIRRSLELRPPSPEAKESGIRRYLATGLRLFEAYQRLEDSDPLAQEMARLAHHDATPLLEALETASLTGSRLLLEALHRGLGPEQKDRILQRAIDHPELATLLKTRGWYPDARHVVETWITSPLPLPIDALRLLLWLDLPEADQRVLKVFQDHPDRQLHELLSSIPRLAAALDAEIHRIWAVHQTPWQCTAEHPEAFELALSHGIQEASTLLIQRILKQKSDASMFNHTVLRQMNRFFPDEAPEPHGWTSYQSLQADVTRLSSKGIPTFHPAWRSWTFEPLTQAQP